MSIATELTLLANSKQAIKNSINQKGGSITDSTPFADYSTAIDNLPSGGSDSTLRDLIERDITSITIPSGTTKIGAHAFDNCRSLTSITIPNGVTEIGQAAFSQCVNLVSITLPSTLTLIFVSAFEECKFTNFVIPSGITTIHNRTFYNCSNLANITIPNTVTTINSAAFYGCMALKNVIIPNSVASIDGSAFNQCRNLESLVFLPTTPPTISGTNPLSNTNNCPIYVPSESVAAYKAASNWSSLASRIFAIGDAITFTPTNGDPAISVKNYDLATANYVQSSDVPSTIKNGAGSLEIGEGVTRIGMSAFQNGSSLTNVTLPSTLTRIDEVAFNGCSSLTSVTVNADTPPTLYAAAFDSTNNCPIYVPRMSVDTYKAASGWSTYASRIFEIPVTVATLTLNDTSTVDIIDTTGLGTIEMSQTSQYASTTVGALIKSDTLGISTRAFRNFANLASVTFESGSQCTTIGTNAFQNCTSLTSITLPDLVSGIDTSAFSGCTSLETVTIGDSITDIGGSAFAGCESLTDITILADAAPDGSGEDPFEGCDASITMHVPAESVEAYEAWLNDDLGTAADITVAAISE